MPISGTIKCFLQQHAFSRNRAFDTVSFARPLRLLSSNHRAAHHSCQLITLWCWSRKVHVAKVFTEIKGGGKKKKKAKHAGLFNCPVWSSTELQNVQGHQQLPLGCSELIFFFLMGKKSGRREDKTVANCIGWKYTHTADELQADCFGSEADTQHFLQSFAPNPSSPSSMKVLGKQLLFNGKFSLFQKLCC